MFNSGEARFAKMKVLRCFQSAAAIQSEIALFVSLKIH
jgi:hypothetical protein